MGALVGARAYGWARRREGGQTGEQEGKQAGERIGGQAGGRTDGRASEQVGERVCGWVLRTVCDTAVTEGEIHAYSWMQVYSPRLHTWRSL